MMLSAPDHTVLSLPIYKCLNSLFLNEKSDSSNLHMSSDCPEDESKIFNSIQHSEDTNIEILSPTSDSENVMDVPLILEHEDDLYEINQHL